MKTVSFSALWEQGQGTGELCTACRDPIYGNKFTLIMVVMPAKPEETSFRKQKAALCEPCYTLKE